MCVFKRCAISHRITTTLLCRESDITAVYTSRCSGKSRVGPATPPNICDTCIPGDSGISIVAPLLYASRGGRQSSPANPTPPTSNRPQVMWSVGQMMPLGDYTHAKRTECPDVTRPPTPTAAMKAIRGPQWCQPQSRLFGTLLGSTAVIVSGKGGPRSQRGATMAQPNIVGRRGPPIGTLFCGCDATTAGDGEGARTSGRFGRRWGAGNDMQDPASRTDLPPRRTSGSKFTRKTRTRCTSRRPQRRARRNQRQYHTGHTCERRRLERSELCG